MEDQPQDATKTEKKRLLIDWNSTRLNDDDPPPELIVKPSNTTTTTTTTTTTASVVGEENFDHLSDQKLDDSIRSKTNTLESYGSNLRDGGLKLRSTINRLLEEKERRRRIAESDKRLKPTHSTGNTSSGDASYGISGCVRQQTVSSESSKQSSFGNIFLGKMEKDCKITNASIDRPFEVAQCNLLRSKNNKKLSPSKRKRAGKIAGSSSSHQSLRGRSVSIGRDGHRSYHDKISSSYPVNSFKGSCFSWVTTRKNESLLLPSCDLKTTKRQTVDLEDEEDCELIETAERAEKDIARLKDSKIHYPPRDDAVSIELCYSDMECLNAERYLTSPIMNFYILYLQEQASLSSRGISDYHFFNTYFYKKLQETVSLKENGKEAFYTKLRRWWRGVNLFQKAYVFIPVHEDLHWSLAIICCPDKNDESGPIILHLDSLGLHCSKSIFENIKSCLVAEWNHLKQNDIPSDAFFAEGIWRVLPNCIYDKIIAVPQQRNAYDCGLFVLYFMERFIEKAPDRLKRKNLAMFGNRWFKPEEASSLRRKIRKILIKEFENAIGGQNAPG